MQGIGGESFSKVLGTSKFAKGEAEKALTDLEKDAGEEETKLQTVSKSLWGQALLLFLIFQIMKRR